MENRERWREETVKIDHEGSQKREGKNVKKGRGRIERGGDCVGRGNG